MRLSQANWPFAFSVGFAAIVLLFIMEFFADRIIVGQARTICSDSEIDYVSTQGWGAWVECTALEGENKDGEAL